MTGNTKIHIRERVRGPFGKSYERAACGSATLSGVNHTHDASAVTCLACQKTNAFKLAQLSSTEEQRTSASVASCLDCGGEGCVYCRPIGKRPPHASAEKGSNGE